MNTKLHRILTPSEQSQLATLLRESPSHRVRQRCQALLWSHQGHDRQTMATLFTIKADTVSAWFKRWQANHLAGLLDQARSGRPTKLTQQEKKPNSTGPARLSQPATLAGQSIRLAQPAD